VTPTVKIHFIETIETISHRILWEKKFMGNQCSSEPPGGGVKSKKQKVYGTDILQIK
jgi:hypothetical protein